MTHPMNLRLGGGPLLAAIGLAVTLVAGPAWSRGDELLKTDCNAKPNAEECKAKAAATDQGKPAAPAATQPSDSERPARGAKIK